MNKNMRLNPLLFALCSAAALCACSRPDPVANGAAPVNLGEPANPAPAPVPTPPDNAIEAAPGATSDAATSIPAALQGRWGLTPGDCTSTRGDAKGLMIVSASDLRFYESRAVPTADVQKKADSINGHFDFTGEGQQWSKFQSLKVDGNLLVRTETDPAASYTYAKC